VALSQQPFQAADRTLPNRGGELLDKALKAHLAWFLQCFPQARETVSGSCGEFPD
jgi:hypothetical protein